MTVHQTHHTKKDILYGCGGGDKESWGQIYFHNQQKISKNADMLGPFDTRNVSVTVHSWDLRASNDSEHICAHIQWRLQN